MRFLGIDKNRSKQIWRLAIPIITGTITIMIMNQTDRIMIGRWNESLSGAALSTATQAQMFILLIALILGSSMTIALQTISSRRKGEGKPLEAGETFQTGVFLSVFLGLIATVLTLIFHRQIISLLTDNDTQMLALGVPYLFWRSFELVFVIIMFSYRGFFNGIGRPRIDMYFTILRVGLNIFLNFCLIYGYFGFIELGVEGAAIATLVSTIISFVGFTLYVIFSKWAKKYKYLKLRNPLQLKKILSIIRLSIPGALQFAAMFGFIYFNKVIISEYGQDMGGASSIMFAVSNIMFMFNLGLGIAGATLVGQSLGRGKPELAKTYVWDIIKLAMFVMLIYSTVVIIFPSFILQIYTSNKLVVNIGVLPLRIFLSTQVINAAGIILIKCLQGAGAQKQVTVFEYIGQFWLIVVTYILAFVFRVPFWGLWVGFISYQVLLTFINFVYFKTNRWQLKKV